MASLGYPMRAGRSSSSALLQRLTGRQCQYIGSNITASTAVKATANSAVWKEVWTTTNNTTHLNPSNICHFSTVAVKRERTPSVLTKIPPEEWTVRRAFAEITQKYKGGFPVRHDDVQEIINQTQTGDARFIYHVLSHLKRCYRFILNQDEAQQAMSSMLKHHNADDDTFSAALFVGKAFVDQEGTGLYFAATVDSVEEFILKPMMEAEQNSEEARDMVVEIIKLLLIRGSRPYQRMKKRAARKYLKHLECPTGPYPSTLHMAIQIILSSSDDIATNLTIAQKLSNRYANTNRTILEETTQLMSSAQTQLDAAAEAEAAAAAAEAATQEIDDEATTDETETSEESSDEQK